MFTLLLSALLFPTDYTVLTVPVEVAPTYDFTSTTSVAAYITDQAKAFNIPVERALYVAGHESDFIASTTGDLLPMKDGIPAHARGLWQITRKYHPEISDECAYDVMCSTAWAMERLGDVATCKKEWTTCRSYAPFIKNS